MKGTEDTVVFLSHSLARSPRPPPVRQQGRGIQRSQPRLTLLVSRLALDHPRLSVLAADAL